MLTRDLQQSDWSIGFSNAVPERGDERHDSQGDAKSLISILPVLAKGPTYRNMRPITYVESRTPIRHWIADIHMLLPMTTLCLHLCIKSVESLKLQCLMVHDRVLQLGLDC
jgi:hypothetical protein